MRELHCSSRWLLWGYLTWVHKFRKPGIIPKNLLLPVLTQGLDTLMQRWIKFLFFSLGSEKFPWFWRFSRWDKSKIILKGITLCKKSERFGFYLGIENVQSSASKTQSPVIPNTEPYNGLQWQINHCINWTS